MYILPIVEYSNIWRGCTQVDGAFLESVQLPGAHLVIGATCHMSHALLYNETGWEMLLKWRARQTHVQINVYNNKWIKSIIFVNSILGIVSSRNIYNVRSNNDISQVRARSNILFTITPSYRRQSGNGICSNADDLDNFRRKFDKNN